MKKEQLPRILIIAIAMALCSLSAMATLNIKGWISDVDDNYVADATVSICDATDTPLFSTTTDRWGDYKLTLGESGLVGDYTLKVTAAGYAPASKTVTLTEADETLKDQDFVLQLSAAKISGTVSDASYSYMKLIYGATITLSLDGVTVATATSADWVGDYSLTVTDVDPDKVYVLTAAKTGYDTLTQEISLNPGESLSLPLKLYPEGTTPKPVTNTEVSGSVKSDYDVSPIEGATVTLTEGEDTLATATTDEDGNFKISIEDRALSGEYTLTAAADGYASAAVQVQIADGKADTVEIRLEQEVTSCKLTVGVKDESNRSLSGVKGTLSLDGATVATDESFFGAMEFQIDKVSSEPYTLTLELEGYETIVEPGIELVAGENQSLSFVMIKEEVIVTTEVKGKVVNKTSGKALRGVRVSLMNGEDTLDYEFSDADGAFTIKVNEKLDGTYTLNALFSGYAEIKKEIQIVEGVCEEILLEMEKQYTVLDIVVIDDVTQQPVPDANIVVEEHYDSVVEGKTDAEGRCRLEFAAQPGAEYDLIVTCRKYNNYSKSTTFNAGEVNSIEVRLLPTATVVDAIEIDGADRNEKIFNLQGQAVKDLSAPGVYIVVRNGKRVKVIK